MVYRAADVSDPVCIESSSLPVWVHHAVTGRFLVVSDVLLSSYGWSRDQMLSMTLDDVVAPETRDRLFRATPEAVFVDGGTHRRRDGSTLRAEVNVQQARFGNRPAWVVIVLDVTDRLRAEQELVKSQRQLADAQELAHLGSFEWDIEANEVSWSDELYRIYGLKPRQFKATYEAFLDHIDPDDREKVDTTIRRAVESGQPFHMEERIVRPDGEIRILESRGQLVPGQNRLVGVCRDVTELRAAEEEREELARREREARLSAERAHAQISEILERITDAFVALDSDWRYTYVNRRAAEILGCDRESLVGRYIWSEFPEDAAEPFHRAYEQAMATQQPVLIEEYLEPWDKWFENRIYPSPNGLAVYFQDVTERRRKEDELREANERLARTEAFSLVMAMQIGLEGDWIRIPPNLCRFLGYTEEELRAKGFEANIHPDDREDDRTHRARILRGETRSEDIELRLVRTDGTVAWVGANYSGVYDRQERLNHFLIYMRDITERHRAEEQIRYQALHDDLTDLPNRVLFNDRLTQAIGHAHRHDRRIAVISADLDNFKLVNDNFGHSFGDIVIRDVAARLKSALRSTDTIARLGGDEFAIIVEDMADENHPREIAEKIREVISIPFDVGTHSAGLTMSIGISIYPRDGRDRETLFRSSAAALNRAKELGMDNIQLFDETMSGRFRDRLVLEHELRTAVQERQLVPYYQPIVRLSDQKVVAVEALIRWIHPQRGIVGPDSFIPLAEETRLIVPIGELALRSACRDVRRLTDQGIDLRLSVNLSARQFQELNLLRAIEDILDETGFSACDLELEVTETVAMKNADFTMNLLRELRRRDISIAIDDFGAGQTSLIYLRQFPINNIKIDKVFIHDMEHDATDAAIVRAVINLAHTLGLTTTAEGVETAGQARILHDIGCDLMQGYYVSRPMAAGELENFLAASPRT